MHERNKVNEGAFGVGYVNDRVGTVIHSSPPFLTALRCAGQWKPEDLLHGNFECGGEFFRQRDRAAYKVRDRLVQVRIESAFELKLWRD